MLLSSLRAWARSATRTAFTRDLGSTMPKRKATVSAEVLSVKTTKISVSTGTSPADDTLLRNDSQPESFGAGDENDALRVQVTESPAGKPKAPARKRASKKKAWPPGPLYSQDMRPPPPEGPSFKFLSWNIAGLRALLKKDAETLKALVQTEQPDVICLQETKIQEKHVEDLVNQVGLQDWGVHWSCSTAKLGYSGTAVFCKQPPMSVRTGMGHAELDEEGRVITVEYPNFWIVNVYVPNSGDGLKRLELRTSSWDKAFAAYLKQLEQTKPVIATGDFNCAHKEIDIHSPETNLRSAGFTQEERDSFTANFIENGFVDTFRTCHPDVVGYTYFSYRFNMRAKGKGWRLDYFLVSESLRERVHDSYILQHLSGSDHVPIGLILCADGWAQ